MGTRFPVVYATPRPGMLLAYSGKKVGRCRDDVHGAHGDRTPGFGDWRVWALVLESAGPIDWTEYVGVSV